MNRKFKPGSEESINLIMESLKMAGIDCRRIKEGEEGGLYYTDENGETKNLLKDFNKSKVINCSEWQLGASQTFGDIAIFYTSMAYRCPKCNGFARHRYHFLPTLWN